MLYEVITPVLRTFLICSINSSVSEPTRRLGKETATFSPNNQLIGTASWDRRAKIWDAKTGVITSYSIHYTKLYERLFSAGRLAAAERYFSRFGLLAFLSGRFIPFGAGNSVVASAGLARLPLPRFLAYTLVSCLTYALVYFYGTFLFGPALFRGPGGLVILALLVTILAITMIASRRTPDTSAPVSRPATPLGDGLS